MRRIRSILGGSLGNLVEWYDWFVYSAFALYFAKSFALIPGYATIGIAAPLLLTFARMLQGLSVGGEFGASATYLAEIADPKHRGFWASFQYVTLILGQLLALGVLLLLQFVFLDEAALEAWGWRIPFAIGAVLAVVVFYIRRGIEETPDFLDEDVEALRKTGVRCCAIPGWC